MDNPNQFVSPVIFNQPAAPAPIKKMKWWKKLLLTLLVVAVLFGLGVYNLPRILTLLYPKDSPLVDNVQLLLKSVSVPDADNGFYDFTQINNCTSDSPSDCSPTISIPKGFDDLAYTNYTKPIKWDQSAVDQVLKANEQALTLFDQAVRKNNFQIPDYADPANLHTELRLYPMNSWRQVARLQAIKALSLSYQGQPDQALLEAVKLNKLGHQIINGHNNLIGALVGLAIEQLGSQTILEILPYGNPTQTTLVTVQNSIQKSSENIEGYKNAFRFEYTHTINSIDETTNSQLETTLQRMIKNGETSPAYANYVKYKYYYKPNQTKNLYTSLYSREVSAVGTRCELNDLDQQVGLSKSPIAKWKLLFTENAIGKMMFSLTGIALGSAVTKDCQNDLVANIAQIELALKGYIADNGSLPIDLNALVPKYLASVPVDLFDGQPIRYSAEKKILYSVGVNKKDLGGQPTGTDWAKMENPTFEIKLIKNVDLQQERD